MDVVFLVCWASIDTVSWDAVGACPSGHSIPKVYDMLPMFYAPRYGAELTGGLHPTLAIDAAPPSAFQAARRFGERLAEDVRVSASFQRMAQAAAARCAPVRR